MSLFNPTAAIAATIKNLLIVFSGLNIAPSTPNFSAIVVIKDAAIKYRIKNGNIFLKSTDLPVPPFFFAVRVRISASTKVIGIIASVRVSFTVTALSNVRFPRFHILSHVEAAAVTEDVSFTAVPANIPNASPVVVSNPTSFPNIGKITAASTLKKNITEIACATSSSPASITGAVAATAEPPHIDEPTPTSVEIFAGILSAFCKINAVKSEAVIVHTMIGSDCLPVFRITV